MAEDIKAVARKLMSEHGTAGLTLRGIAREMGVTAPAIYHYFPRLDDLITALIVDAYTALSVALEAAAATTATVPERILAALWEYRAWALAHPIEFQLILGNPIPGYAAPDDITEPLAARPFMVIGGLLEELHQEGLLILPALYAAIPPSIAEHIEQWRAINGYTVSNETLYLFIVGWTRIHGIVTLELFNHIQPSVGDTDAFYRHELRVFLTSLGLNV